MRRVFVVPEGTSRRDRDTFGQWLRARKKRGESGACYGLYLWVAEIQRKAQKLRFAEIAKANRRLGSEATRKRPAWCSARLYKQWTDYTKKCCSGIPLDVYASPILRREWLDARMTKPLPPREMARALLKRKGLAP